MRIVATCPVSERHVARLLETVPTAEIQVCRDIAQAQPFLAAVEVLLTYGEDLTAEILDACPRLRWIQVISAGLELLPWQALQERQILVTNARGIHRVPMAEHTLGMILAFARRFWETFRNQGTATWDRSIRVEEITGKVLGVIGAGAIGGEIAQRAQAFGMRTIGLATVVRPLAGFDEVVDRTGLDRLLTESDYVVVAVPLTRETQGMIGARELSLMQTTAVLINIARGKVIDEEALLEALQSGKIRGAALDVFATEPLPADHPFWSLTNCVLTPHISGRSPKYMERAQEIFRHNLKVYMTGTGVMVNVVDLNRGY